MRKIFRYGLRAVIAVMVICAAVPIGFRIAATLREARSPIEAAGQGATFRTVDGLAFHYRESGPQSGHPLLLIPGAMAWSGTWHDIAEPLAGSGFRVIALDMPPFGFSERPADGDYSRAAQSRRILGFADAMGLDSFTLVGHSFGGGATLEAALSAPERIEKLVLLDVALGLQESAERPRALALMEWAQLRNLVASATFTNPLLIGKGLRDFVYDDRLVTEERIAIYKQPLSVTGTTAAVGNWLRTGLYGDETASRAANLVNYRAFVAPVLIVWGRDDTVTPVVQAEEIAAAFPNDRLVILDEVNHIPHIEKPDEVARQITEFLAGGQARQ